MISYASDGVTLIDANGKRVSPFQGVDYNALVVIRDAQIAAQNENNHAVDVYTTGLKNAQASIDAGRPADAPPKPPQHVVSDTGVSTYAPFSPALPDLVPAVINAPNSGSIKVETQDTQAIMFAMVTAIYRKMFPGA